MKNTILVVDSCVWIDLHSVNLLEGLAKLPYRVMLTDFVGGELESPSNEVLEELGFDIVEMTDKEIDDVFQMFARYKKTISVQDASNLVLAKRYANDVVFLVSHDSKLQRAAIAEDINCMDALDLLDEMITQGCLNLEDARELVWELRRGRPNESERKCIQLLNKWNLVN